MTRALVIGASGLVGSHLLAALGPDAIGTFHRNAMRGLVQLDVTDTPALETLVSRHKPETLYLAAYQPNVDACESQPEETWQTNVAGVRNVVAVANRHGCALVFLSSEYVFDGVAGPYREDDPANPISVYGLQKLAAEHHIALAAAHALIVRTTVVFGLESRGKNFLYRLTRTLRAGNAIKVPRDQISSPTYAPDLARAAVALSEQGMQGVVHVAGPRVVSRYDFAVDAARVFGLDAGLIEPVTTEELGQAAPRPRNAGLIVEKAERALGRAMRDDRCGLEEIACDLQ